MDNKKLKPNFRKNYFKIIENSLGTKIFRNFYTEKPGKDIIESGKLSCAWYASTILVLSGFIDKPRLTVDSLEEDLIKNGWEEIKNMKKGAVIIWEAKEARGSNNRHIGFCISKNKAVSNDPQKGYPTIHHCTFGVKNKRPERKIEKIYWHNKLDA